jgi:Ca-activated chloride channel family protein
MNNKRPALLPPTAIGVLGALCVLVVNSASAADVGRLMRQGNGQYARGRYDTALGRYQMAEVLEPDASTIHYNLGNTLFRLGRYQEAARELDPAIQAYKQALVQNPHDKEAKQNLEFCLLKKQQQKNDSSQQNKQQNQPQNQPQQPQQQQQQNQPQMQQQQQGMGKDQAERLVQAVENKERNQQREQQQRGGRRKVDQDW